LEIKNGHSAPQYTEWIKTFTWRAGPQCSVGNGG
jgi:hypothetical protein